MSRVQCGIWQSTRTLGADARPFETVCTTFIVRPSARELRTRGSRKPSLDPEIDSRSSPSPKASDSVMEPLTDGLSIGGTFVTKDFWTALQDEPEPTH